MAERQRVGGLTAVDPAVAEWQKRAAENPATVSAKQKRDRKRVRIFVDVTPELKANLEEIASWDHEDTSVSQVTEILLLYAALAYRRGDPALRAGFSSKTRARTPRFAWNLEIPEAWETELAQKQPNGKVSGKG